LQIPTNEFGVDAYQREEIRKVVDKENEIIVIDDEDSDCVEIVKEKKTLTKTFAEVVEAVSKPRIQPKGKGHQKSLSSFFSKPKSIGVVHKKSKEIEQINFKLCLQSDLLAFP